MLVLLPPVHPQAFLGFGGHPPGPRQKGNPPGLPLRLSEAVSERPHQRSGNQQSNHQAGMLCDDAQSWKGSAGAPCQEPERLSEAVSERRISDRAVNSQTIRQVCCAMMPSLGRGVQRGGAPCQEPERVPQIQEQNLRDGWEGKKTSALIRSPGKTPVLSDSTCSRLKWSKSSECSLPSSNG